MTNYEWYKEEIEKYWKDGVPIAVVNGKVRRCSDIDGCCGICEFSKKRVPCSITAQRWLVSEYKEPEVDWSKVPVDTPILVSDCSKDNPTRRRYFAGIVDGKIYVYRDGCTSWSTDDASTIPWTYAKLAREEDMEKYCK